MAHSAEHVEEIRRRTDLLALIGRTVVLKQKGKEHEGLCPFHSEKTASFTVSSEKGFYHCFGCSAHGDAFAWVMHSEKVDFPTAVDRLASDAGVAKVPSGTNRYQPDTPRTGFTNKAKKYQRPVPPPKARPAVRGTAVEAYLRGERGLTSETIAVFSIAQADVLEGHREDTGEPWSMKGPWILFPFLRPKPDGGLELANIKWLHIERKDGKKRTRQEKNAEPSLFGWHRIKPEHSWVIIEEGEINAMTWDQLGWPALATPAGAGTGHKHDWIDSDWDRLAQFREFYLRFDDDEPGQLALEEVAGRLGKHRCRRLKLPHKDINDCIAKAGMTAEEIYPFLRDAEEMRPARLRNASEFTDAVEREFYPIEEELLGIPLPWGSPDNFRLRDGEVTLFTGATGSGKSAAVSQIVLHCADRGWRACVASMELPARIMLKRKASQAWRASMPTREEIRSFGEWLQERIWVWDILGSTTVDDLMGAFIYARRRYGCKIFVIDSFMRCSIKGDDLEAQDSFLKRLVDFALEESCHVILIAHGRKRQDAFKPMAIEDIKGSGGISDNAFNGFILWRDKTKERRVETLQQDTTINEVQRMDKLDKLRPKPDARLICDKQRNGTWQGTIRLWFDRDSVSYRDKVDGRAPRVLTLEGTLGKPQQDDLL